MEQAAILGEAARVSEGSVRIEDLFDAHYPRLCRLAYVIVGDRSVAEEVVMEAFLRTMTGWRRIRDLDRAEAYLQRAVVNLSRTTSRRRVTESRAVAAVRAQPEADVGDGMDRFADADPVLRAVRALPHRQRAAVVLRFYADLTEAQVADVLGCSVGTVKSQISKAKATLARTLAAEELQ